MRVQILTFTLFSVICICIGASSMDTPFVNWSVYRIQSRLNEGVLTANKSRIHPLVTNRTIVATTEVWIEDAGQMWRLDSSALYTAFELKPTSNEDYQLEYDAEKNFFVWVASLGFGNNRLWYLDDAGAGYTLVRNLHNNVCLIARGIGQSLDAGKCDNSIAQQWKFIQLK